jgi:hypothetical protein
MIAKGTWMGTKRHSGTGNRNLTQKTNRRSPHVPIPTPSHTLSPKYAMPPAGKVKSSCRLGCRKSEGVSIHFYAGEKQFCNMFWEPFCFTNNERSDSCARVVLSSSEPTATAFGVIAAIRQPSLAHEALSLCGV